MNQLNVFKLGFAVGSTGLLLYIGCALVLMILGHETSILFFNSLLHGLDVSSVVRMDTPLWEVLIGLVETFIIGWLIGASIASLYNFSLKSK